MPVETVTREEALVFQARTKQPDKPDQITMAIAQDRKRIVDLVNMMKPGNESIIKNAITSGASPQDAALEILRCQDGQRPGAQALVQQIKKHRSPGHANH